MLDEGKYLKSMCDMIRRVQDRINQAERSGHYPLGSPTSARKVDVRLYDRFFTVPDPGNYEDPKSVINSESMINGHIG